MRNRPLALAKSRWFALYLGALAPLPLARQQSAETPRRRGPAARPPGQAQGRAVQQTLDTTGILARPFRLRMFATLVWQERGKAHQAFFSSAFFQGRLNCGGTPMLLLIIHCWAIESTLFVIQ